MERELHHAQNIYGSLRGYLEQAGESFQASVNLSDSAVRGHLNHMCESFALNFRCGVLRKRHLLEIWINHLFANAAGLDIETISVSRGKGSNGKASRGKDQTETNRMHPVRQDEAIAYLDELASLYRQGLSSPLCFPPEATFSFVEAMAKSHDAVTARDAAIRKWNDGDYSEGKDIYWTRLFDLPQDLDNNFAERAQQVYGNLLSYWEEG